VLAHSRLCFVRTSKYFLKSSGQIAVGEVVASLAGSAASTSLPELVQWFRPSAIAMMRRCFSTGVRRLSHENPLVRPHDPDIGTLLNSIQGLPRKGAPPTVPRAQRGLPQKRKIQNVSKIVAVSSAKGGVGKSTIAGMINLRCIILREHRLKQPSQPCSLIFASWLACRYP
jgi:hypothetical protein